jgi:hypothetical protein
MIDLNNTTAPYEALFINRAVGTNGKGDWQVGVLSKNSAIQWVYAFGFTPEDALQIALLEMEVKTAELIAEG